MKMTEKHKFMAYILSLEFNYSQTKIANLMDVSQSTIANAIKDVKYLKTIQDLTRQLNDARQEIAANGLKPVYPVLYLND